jgi:hypothetical protein
MSQIGQQRKLDPMTFRGERWQLVTDTQAIKSVLKAIGARDDDYRALYVYTDKAEAKSPMECWAGWHQVPSNGSLFVCLYDRGELYNPWGDESEDREPPQG